MKKLISTLLAISCTASLCFSTTYATETAEDTLLYGDYLSYQTVDENSDGTADFVRITDCDISAVEVEIPAEIDGLPVTEIGDRAFEWCDVLTNVDIPKSVTLIDSYAFMACKALPQITIPESVTEIGNFAFDYCLTLTELTIPGSVKEMGISAFSRCKSLSDVTISDGVTKVGISAFYDCKALNNVNIPSSVTLIEDGAFSHCTSLETVLLPEGVTTIGNSAFEGCSALININIPNSITSLEDRAFFKCSKLTSIEISENVALIERETFEHCSELMAITVSDENNVYCDIDGVLFDKDEKTLICYPEGKTDKKDYVIPDGVEKINEYAFSRSLITSVVIPETVTEIAEHAFYVCESLEKANIPENVKIIEDAAFSACYSLNDITIPDCVTKFGNGVFSHCKSMTNITFENGITMLGHNTFYNCSSLENIIIPESVNEIGDFTFSGTLWLENKKTENPLVIVNNIVIDGTSCEGNVVIPEGTLKINDYAFQCCETITGIKIPSTVKSIGRYAFGACTSLTEVEIPEGLTDFGAYALSDTPWIESITDENKLAVVNNVLLTAYGCTGDIIVPDNVTKIARNAFYSCTKVKNIVLPESVAEISEQAFFGCMSLENITIENPECIIFDAHGTIAQGDDYDTRIPYYGGVIIGAENSTAYEYAQKYNRNFSIIGSNEIIQPAVTTVPVSQIVIGTDVSAIITQSTTQTTVSETSPVSTTAISTMTILPTATTTSSLSELTTTTTTSTTTSINEPTTTTSEATEKIYDINNEAYRNYVDSLGEKIAYEEEFVAYLNEKRKSLIDADIEDCAVTHVYNVVGNENVMGVNSRRYFVESIIPGTNEKARKFEKISFYWGTSDEDEYAFGFFNDEEVFGGDYVANEINAYLEEKNLNARVITVEKGGSPAKKVVHYDDTSEENVVATFLAINEKFGAEVIAYPNAMEFADIFYDDSILVGDANGDDELNVRDCAFIASKLADNDTDSISKTADYNTDGRIDVRDAAAIAKNLAQVKS